MEIARPNTPPQILANSDAKLGQIIANLSVPVLASTHDVFHDLMSCILEQQIHYRSTKRIFQKLLDIAGIQQLTIDNFGQLEAKALGAPKLSASKYETLVATLDFWQQGPVDWTKLSDEEVRAHLKKIKGIGPWTMDMILLYTLERPNIFPADDFHLKEIMVKIYGLDPNTRLRAQMLEVAQAWEGHRSLAVRYLLDWKATQKKDKPISPKDTTR